MTATALAPAYGGDFEAFLHDDDATMGELLTSYARNFHEPFIDLAHPMYVTDEEARRCIEWCLFYGKPKKDYPPLNRD